MNRRLVLAVAAAWIAGISPASAQEHGAAHPKPVSIVEPVKIAPASAPASAPATTKPAPHDAKPQDAKAAAPKSPRTITVTPAVPSKEVAAAIAEAMRTAEAAAARRARPSAPSVTTRTRTTPRSQRRYQVNWPDQRLVVRWPTVDTDHVTLVWPSAVAPEPGQAPIEP